MEKKFDENGGFVAPKLTVMAPRVVNEDGPSESVASEGLKSDIEYSPVTEASKDGSKFDPMGFDEAGKMFDPERDQIKGFTKESVVDGYATFTDKPVSRNPEDELNVEPGT